MADQLDQELVRRVQKGDKKAFDIIVTKYQHKMIQLISRYTKDPGEALDIAQESFIKAYRALPNFRGESALYTWLYRIAINTAKNHLVARARRPSNNDIDVRDAEQFEGAARLRDQDSPEHLILTDEIAQTIQLAISTDLFIQLFSWKNEGFTVSKVSFAWAVQIKYHRWTCWLTWRGPDG